MLSDFLCEPRPSERDILLHELAARYHAETEAFDRLVCTGPITRDGIQPANYRELGAISRNARKAFDKLAAISSGQGISRKDLHRAISSLPP